MYRLHQAPVPVLAASLALLLAGPVSAATPSPSASACRAPGSRRTTGTGRTPPLDLRRRPLRRLRVRGLQPRGGRHEPRRDLFVRDRKQAPRSASACRAPECSRTTDGRTSSPPSPPTAASSRSSPTPPTSWRATRTARMTSSCATAERHDERVSVSSAGEQGNVASYYPSISADGRFVAFSSPFTNLVPADTNGFTDVFVCDRNAGTTERVSVSQDGPAGRRRVRSSRRSPPTAATSRSPRTRPTRRTTHGLADVFVKDRQAGTTRARASRRPGTGQRP